MRSDMTVDYTSKPLRLEGRLEISELKDVVGEVRAVYRLREAEAIKPFSPGQ